MVCLNRSIVTDYLMTILAEHLVTDFDLVNVVTDWLTPWQFG